MQKFLGLAIVFGISILLTPNIISAQSSTDIEIKANLKKGDYIDTNLWFPNENMNLSLAKGNSICPDSNCKIEIQDGTFNTLGSTDRYIGGTLKIEDKSKSDPQGNF